MPTDMDAPPPVDGSFARLHRAGWSVGDVRLLTAAGAVWLVSGSNGEKCIASGRLPAHLHRLNPDP
jgi:hypothetical protein